MLLDPNCGNPTTLEFVAMVLHMVVAAVIFVIGFWGLGLLFFIFFPVSGGIASEIEVRLGWYKDEENES